HRCTTPHATVAGETHQTRRAPVWQCDHVRLACRLLPRYCWTRDRSKGALMTIRPRRSVLYMPGSNARAIEKAKTLQADGIIIDLEDAVAPDAKDSARAQVAQAVRAGGFGSREVM